MNKVMTIALVAGGLMLMNSPEAAAHKEVRHIHQAPAYYHYYPGADVPRARHMPRWLKHNDSFRRWYGHTPLRRNGWIAWGELYDIYRWERRYTNRVDRRYRHYNQSRRWGHRDDRGGHRQGRRHRH